MQAQRLRQGYVQVGGGHDVPLTSQDAFNQELARAQPQPQPQPQQPAVVVAPAAEGPKKVYLNACGFCFSLRTGMKIILTFDLIVRVLGLVAVIAAVAFFAHPEHAGGRPDMGADMEHSGPPGMGADMEHSGPPDMGADMGADAGGLNFDVVMLDDDEGRGHGRGRGRGRHGHHSGGRHGGQDQDGSDNADGGDFGGDFGGEHGDDGDNEGEGQERDGGDFGGRPRGPAVNPHMLFAGAQNTIGLILVVLGIVGMYRDNERFVKVYSRWSFVTIALSVAFTTFYLSSGMARTETEKMCGGLLGLGGEDSPPDGNFEPPMEPTSDDDQASMEPTSDVQPPSMEPIRDDDEAGAGGDEPQRQHQREERPPFRGDGPEGPEAFSTVEECTEAMFGREWRMAVPALLICSAVQLYVAFCVLSFYNRMVNQRSAAQQNPRDMSSANVEFGDSMPQQPAPSAPASVPSAPAPAPVQMWAPAPERQQQPQQAALQQQPAPAAAAAYPHLQRGMYSAEQVYV